MMLSKQNRFYKPGVCIDEKDIKTISFLKEKGSTISKIVKTTGISFPTVSKYFHNIKPTITGPRKKREIMTTEIIECILFYTERQPSIQLQEIQQKLIDTGICTIENCPSQNSISKSLRNDLLLTRKKIRVVPRESQTAQIETKLDDFINFISTSNANNLYFFDETSFLKTSGNRKYGYALYGHEPIEIQRYASSATLTVNLMHSRSGVAYFNFVEGPSDSLHLLNFFVEVFHQRIYGLPILKPGDIVIMDNCRFHHSRLIQNQLQYLFRVNGVTLRYQPPYHPELNTCEYCFKLIKDGIKRENHYYEEHMELAICNSVVNNINRTISENIFYHCGYT
ncbi:unnamed protein product [Mytilus edulis]|uniref:Paired domain-containing protein n=1 Tax=Mytilus edulis TaxID=6550 RepID=A0A8S3V6D9_MYTED|nr:unnamed protein product [Mytilus edulis]